MKKKRKAGEKGKNWRRSWKEEGWKEAPEVGGHAKRSRASGA